MCQALRVYLYDRCLASQLGRCLCSVRVSALAEQKTRTNGRHGRFPLTGDGRAPLLTSPLTCRIIVCLALKTLLVFAFGLSDHHHAHTASGAECTAAYLTTSASPHRNYIHHVRASPHFGPCSSPGVEQDCCYHPVRVSACSQHQLLLEGPRVARGACSAHCRVLPPSCSTRRRGSSRILRVSCGVRE